MVWWCWAAPHSLAILATAQLVLRPKKEPRVSDRDINNLLDRESSKSAANILELHPIMCGRLQAGHSSNLRYTGEEEAISYRGHDIRRLRGCKGNCWSRSPTTLWVSNCCKGCCFQLMTEYTGAILV